MEKIKLIVEKLADSVAYYEDSPDITVNGSNIVNSNKYVHPDIKRSAELQVLNPLKKLMINDNLTDNFKYSVLGITISKEETRFEVTSCSREYMLFISEFLRNKRHLTDYISITQFIQDFINKINVNEDVLSSFDYNINKYFYINFYLFIHNKMKELYLDTVSKTKQFHKYLVEHITPDDSLMQQALQVFCQNIVAEYTHYLISAIIDFLHLYINPEKIDIPTQNAINEILDILEQNDDYYMLLNNRNTINTLLKTITDNLEKYPTKNNKRTENKINNIIDKLNNANSLLDIDKDELLNSFFKNYLASKISESYPKFHSVFKLIDMSKGYGFNLIAEYIWNNPHQTDEILNHYTDYLHKKAKKSKTELVHKSYVFDGSDKIICNIICAIDYTFPTTTEDYIKDKLGQILSNSSPLFPY